LLQFLEQGYKPSRVHPGSVKLNDTENRFKKWFTQVFFSMCRIRSGCWADLEGSL